MPRPRCISNIGFLPQVTYFKPAGVKMADVEEVILRHDELEAIRLKDLLGIPQEEAAVQMNVSQPTFHRLLLSAHEKMAHTVVNGKALRIDGGNVSVDEKFIPPCGWRDVCRHGWKGEDIYQTGDVSTIEKDIGIMKIAITSIDGTMEGMVDERFGRCRKLIIYDPKSKSFDVIENMQNFNAPQGAGIQSAQNAINAGAKTIISGHLGPNAFRVLGAAGIEVYTVSNKTVAQAIKEFEESSLAKLTGPDVNGHW
jgi:predicted DNA-binding protein (UPF0251 family)/predicted Fe-Mo cluster-binding NifX family protein